MIWPFTSAPPTSPRPRVCDFFLRVYAKDKVYVPPLPTDELRTGVTDAVNAVTLDMIVDIREEFQYRMPDGHLGRY